MDFVFSYPCEVFHSLDNNIPAGGDSLIRVSIIAAMSVWLIQEGVHVRLNMLGGLCIYV